MGQKPGTLLNTFKENLCQPNEPWKEGRNSRARHDGSNEEKVDLDWACNEKTGGPSGEQSGQREMELEVSEGH